MTALETSNGVLAARKASAKLYQEFSAEMQKHCARGLVDCKMRVVAGPETTAAGVIQTLTNVLRLLEDGRARPLSLS